MSSPLRILHLEDDPGDARLIQETLRADGLVIEIAVVHDRPGFEKALAKGDFEIILADHKVPSFGGLEALALTRAQRSNVPFIFVTGALGEDRAVETLKSGATDFVLKDRLSRLAFAVRRALAEAEEHQKRQKAEQTLRWELAVNEAVSLLSTPMISAETTVEEVSEAVLGQALRLTSSQDGLVAAVEVTSQHAACHALTPQLRRSCQSMAVDGRYVFALGPDGRFERGAWCQALNSREPFYANGPTIPFGPATGTPGYGATVQRLLAVPVFLGKELVGQILVCNADRDYSDRDVSGLSRLAERYGLSIQRLRFKYALQAERDFVHAILTTAGALVVVLDTQGRIVRFNQACEQASGYRFDEVAGKVFWELFIVPEELDVVRGVFARLTAGQFPTYCENYWQTRTSSRRRIMWSNTVLLDEHKSVQYVIATGVDVTQAHTAEGKLRVLTRAMEAGPSSVVITDAEGTITYVNPAFAQLTGYTQDEVLGRTPRVWKSGQHPPEFYAVLWQTLKQGLEWRGEFCNRKKQGELFWIYSTISPIKDDAGTITHFVAVIVDITERKRYEQSLERSRRELEDKVAERTADLEKTVESLLREVGARRRAESEIQELLRFERLLTEITTESTRVDVGRFETMIQESIRRLMCFLQAERASLYEAVGDTIYPTLACQAEGIAPVPARLEVSELPWAVAQLRCGKSVRFSNLDELPPEAAVDRETFRKLGTQSLIVLPLVVSGNPIGSLAFINVSGTRTWPTQTLQRLRLVEELFAGLLLRWRSEKALTEAERRFHAVANFMQDWEYWESPEGAILFCSPACERITGYGPHQFLAEPRLLHDLVSAEDASLWRHFHSVALSDPRERCLHFRIRRADGTIRWIDHHSRPVADEHGHFLGLRASNRDHTLEKEAELETQRLRGELARMTRMTMVDHLAASLAHELRQPLTAILSNAEAAQQFLALDPPDLSEVQEALNDVVRNDQRAAEIIHRLRALYRRTGQDRAALDINNITEETLALLRSELILRQVSWQLRAAPGLPTVLANRVQIQQVLMNLVLNAAEAMLDTAAGSRRLLVSTALENPDRVRVSVCDTGTGLDAEAAAHMFEPFFTTKESGMGIGLTISRSIIESHGGAFWAVNNSDGGATFHFTVPVASV